MEDWLNWALVYSKVVMMGDLKRERPELAKAWDYLRCAIQFHLRPTSFLKSINKDNQAYKDAARKAALGLWEFAKILERETKPYAGMKFLTINVRLIVVYSDEMRHWLGSMSLANEFWMERSIRVTESLLGNSTTHCVELVMANANVYKWLIEDYRRERNISSDDKHTHAWKKNRNANNDKPSDDDKQYFLGAATKDGLGIASKQALLSAMNTNNGSGDSNDIGVTESNISIERFVRAKLSATVYGEEVHSLGHLRVRTRDSSCVILDASVDGYQYGQIVEFAKVVDNSQEPALHELVPP